MTIKKIILLLLCMAIIFIPSMVFGEEKSMSLDDGIRIAIKENPKMKKAASKVRQAEEGKVESRGYLLPQLDLGANYSRYGNISAIDLTSYGLSNEELISANNYKYFVGVSQTLFDYRALTQYEQAKLNIIYSQYGYDMTKQEVVYGVERSYYNILKANSLLQLAMDTVKQYELHLDQTQKQYKQGMVPKYDILRVEVSLARAQEGLIDARNNQEISKAQFNNSMGIKIESPVSIKEYLTYEPWVIEYKDSLSYAMANRPDIKQMETMIALAEESIKYAKGERYPALSLNATYMGQNSNLMQQPNNWLLMVQASMPIFHSGVISGKIGQAEEKFTQATQEQQLLLDSSELDVKESYLNLNAAAERMDVVTKNVIQAEESMRMANVRYMGGVANIVELLDTQVALTQAKTDYIRALYDYDIAKVNLEKSMGKLLEKGKDITSDTSNEPANTLKVPEPVTQTEPNQIKPADPNQVEIKPADPNQVEIKPADPNQVEIKPADPNQVNKEGQSLNTCESPEVIISCHELNTLYIRDLHHSQKKVTGKKSGEEKEGALNSKENKSSLSKNKIHLNTGPSKHF